MRHLCTVIGHIPARGGSQRVPAKNLRYLGAKPLLSYAVECALQSGVLDEVYVNTDSDDIAQLARNMGVQVYRRNPALGSDDATGDDFTADFMKNTQPTTLVMISPVCPFVEANDLRTALEAFRTSDCDTLITCHDTQMQTFCAGRAVNIDPDQPLMPTQHNAVVQILNWAVTVWDVRSFLASYAERRNGYIGKKRLLFPIDAAHSIKISREEDFRLAELLLKARGLHSEAFEPARYWRPEQAGTAPKHA